MKYKITYAYCWYNQGSMIVKMYFISGVPFTFDELPHYAYEDPELMKKQIYKEDLNQKIYTVLLFI